MTSRRPPVAPRRSEDVCLVTATTEGFVPGALTAVGSFLERHPRFDGDVVVIHDGLSHEARGYLEALSDRLRLEPVAPALQNRLAGLPDDFNPSPGRCAQFYSWRHFG